MEELTLEVMSNNLLREFEQYQDEFEDAAIATLRSGWYILGNRLSSFEGQFAKYNHIQHCVGLASGLDALWLSFRVLGIGKGDEVIVQANTYIASVMGITINGATPVFVEPDEYYGLDANAIEDAITDKTKAILAVHLYGIPCEMERISEISRKYDLFLIEDCAQSHGASYKDKMTGTFGNIGCFSFYPTKNLGAFGDGGAVITSSEDLAEKFKMYRNYGSQKRYENKVVGANSRLDEIQASLLSVKLYHLEEIIGERRDIANRYNEGIINPKFILPKERPNTKCVYHQYVIRCEDKEQREILIKYLNRKNIGTIIHYPIPPHLSQAYKYLGFEAGAFPITEYYADTVLSIPMYNGLTEEEQRYVINVLNGF